jgi:uncharacterized protein YndB with AHSA1/START domain
MQDIIERKIRIKASKERVYEAIANPQKITTWFPKAIEGTFAGGEKPILDFGEHKTQIYIVAMQPTDYFAYRWVPGGNKFEGDILDAPTTLVEFRITELDGVSTVTLTESGFAQLPPEIAEASFNNNSGGWDYGLPFLEKLFVD